MISSKLILSERGMGVIGVTQVFPLKVELIELILQGKPHDNTVLQYVQYIIVNSLVLLNNVKKVKGKDTETFSLVSLKKSSNELTKSVKSVTILISSHHYHN